MTFDDDFVRLVFDGGAKTFRCAALGLDWPPPETINVAGFRMRRERFSALTDEQRSGMTHVCRGAEYVIVHREGQDDG